MDRSASIEGQEVVTLAPGLDGRLLTAEEVAERLQVTVAWVHEMARREEMPSLKLGKFRRFSSEAIEDWLREHQVGAYKRRAT